MVVKTHNLGDIYSNQIGVTADVFPGNDPFQRGGRMFLINLILKLKDDIGSYNVQNDRRKQGNLDGINIILVALQTNSAPLVKVKDLLQNKLLTFRDVLNLVSENDEQREYILGQIEFLNRGIDLLKKFVNTQSVNFESSTMSNDFGRVEY